MNMRGKPTDFINRFNSFKILSHSDRLRSIADGGLPYPIDWHIYPSNVCNHKCTWCMFRQNGEQENFPDMLSEELLLRAVNDAHRTGAKLIHFSGGGEPLLNKHTKTAMKLAQNLNLKVALSTNGSALSPEIAKLVNYIRVSLNAGTPEQHLRTNHEGQGKGDFHRIIDNIRDSMPYIKQDLGIAFVLDHENYQDIMPFCQIASDLGVSFVHIRPAFYYKDSLDIRTRSIMNQALEFCNQARDKFKNLNIFAITEKFDGFWSKRSYDRCHAVKTGICLRATGDFAVCQDRTDLSFGAEYKNGKDFEEIWHSQEHINLMNTIISGKELDRCPRCVWNNRNKIIEDAFINDDMRIDLI